MTITDNVNFWASVISIIVTIVSIVCAVLSFRSANRAKQYKEETLTIKETLDLRSLLGKFISESQNYQNRTRNTSWYKGYDASLVISPFNEVLRSFGDYYHLMDKATLMKTKVHSLQQTIQNYTRFTRRTQIEVNDLITEITELLQEETLCKTTDMIVNNSHH